MKKFIILLTITLVAFAGYSQKAPLRTIQNLKDGIKGETTASAKYAAFAKKARMEGQMRIATLFEAASGAEAIHAGNHKKALAEKGERIDNFTPLYQVKTTAENLQSALEGETYEVVNMYPQFIREADDENMTGAKKTFVWAFDTEKKHQQFYSRAITSLKSGLTDNLPSGYVVCPVCGNTFDKSKVDERCSFCYTSKLKFINF